MTPSVPDWVWRARLGSATGAGWGLWPLSARQGANGPIGGGSGTRTSACTDISPTSLHTRNRQVLWCRTRPLARGRSRQATRAPRSVLKCTRTPARASTSTRASMLNRWRRPRTRSFTRGWLTPRTFATRAWVSRRRAIPSSPMSPAERGPRALGVCAVSEGQAGLALSSVIPDVAPPSQRPRSELSRTLRRRRRPPSS